jgi:hypothetical protein
MNYNKMPEYITPPMPEEKSNSKLPMTVTFAELQSFGKWLSEYWEHWGAGYYHAPDDLLGTRYQLGQLYQIFTNPSAPEENKADSYPKEVFEPLTETEWSALKTFLKDTGISLDRLSAHYGRIFQKAQDESAAEYITELSEACKSGANTPAGTVQHLQRQYGTVTTEGYERPQAPPKPKGDYQVG